MSAQKPFAERYFPNGVTRAALLKAPAVAFDHLDDMHQAFLQQNFDLPPGSVPCHIVNSSEAFVQLARQGTTCCMIPHLQIEKELESGELIDLTPGLYPAPDAVLAPFCAGKPHDAQRHRRAAGVWA